MHRVRSQKLWQSFVCEPAILQTPPRGSDWWILWVRSPDCSHANCCDYSSVIYWNSPNKGTHTIEVHVTCSWYLQRSWNTVQWWRLAVGDTFKLYHTSRNETAAVLNWLVTNKSVEQNRLWKLAFSLLFKKFPAFYGNCQSLLWQE
jgi:hypothetical protein